jgi:hypothetical protein
MQHGKKFPRFEPLLLASLALLWSILGGLGIARAMDGMTQVPPSYQAGLQTYLETCSGCHVPLPPQILPTETWKNILERPQQHYGLSIPLIRVSQLIIWKYLNFFSRPAGKDEAIPTYLTQARYFRVLHPKVDLPKPTSHRTCISCHPHALKFDYRTLQ